MTALAARKPEIPVARTSKPIERLTGPVVELLKPPKTPIAMVSP